VLQIVDTSGWLEYLADTPQAVHFAAAIEDTERLLVPAVVLYEVFKKVRASVGEAQALTAASHLRQGRVVPVDEAVALLAGRLSTELRLPMADALIYATADLHDAIVLTHDAHFDGLPRGRFIPKA
jgi:predicted nucleic acid-binding protein